MDRPIPRRDFLKATPPAAFVAAHVSGEAVTRAPGSDLRAATSSPGPAADVLESFDYRGVTLGESRWRAQYRAARDYYVGLSEDDILHGFRAAVGLPAPGAPLGGWCARDSSTVFGQWLSGLSRMYRATGDEAAREKAVRLATEFGRTVRADGDWGMRHYAFDKLVCGLVDLQRYGEHDDAGLLLEKVTRWAERALDRTNTPATPALWFGRPNEWYTLAENLYRAFELTGDPRYRTFAEAWLYPSYWNEFADTSDPAGVGGVHAYSHVNTFSSVAMAYRVTGDTRYRTILRNAYDFLQRRQCFATGGFGPVEHIVPSDGALGRALEGRYDSFETVCGSWAGFKMSRYLTRITGEARYGDWMERLFYNGVGAALPITSPGRNFYYADYRVAGGSKQYKRQTYTCCSGTYIQCTVDYHDLVYYRDAEGLYVNLYLPSEVTWQGPGGRVRLTQETDYPEGETSVLTVDVEAPTSFPLPFRVPGWARGVSAVVNGRATGATYAPGGWGEIEREWTGGDRVEITIPLGFRMEPVDEQHPDRVALVRGPVVYVLDAFAHSQGFRLPDTDEELNAWLVADEGTPGTFRLAPRGGRRTGSPLYPFHHMGEAEFYRMYFDRGALPYVIW